MLSTGGGGGSGASSGGFSSTGFGSSVATAGPAIPLSSLSPDVLAYGVGVVAATGSEVVSSVVASDPSSDDVSVSLLSLVLLSVLLESDEEFVEFEVSSSAEAVSLLLAVSLSAEVLFPEPSPAVSFAAAESVPLSATGATQGYVILSSTGVVALFPFILSTLAINMISYVAFLGGNLLVLMLKPFPFV